jgi:Pvc16 N-terminal domain
MSNYFAIATVTATIRNILTNGIRDDIDDIDVDVTSQPPDIGLEQPADRLNIFLYSIVPNIGYSNLDLPSRSPGTGQLIQRQHLGLNLYYLLTAYARDNKELNSQRILGSAMIILNEKSMLTRNLINDALGASPEIVGSDLVDQVDIVKISLNPISSDELSRLWSSFFRANYRTSVSYQATVVLLDSARQQPKPGALVQERGIYVIPFIQPMIERIEPQILEYQSDQRIILIGQNLQGQGIVDVDIDGTKVGVPPEGISNNHIRVTIPAGLPLGVKRIKLFYTLALDPTSPPPSSTMTSSLAPPTTTEKKQIQFKSNVSPFILVPKITTAGEILAQNSDLSFDFQPAVKRNQKVFAMLGSKSIPLLLPKNLSTFTEDHRVPQDTTRAKVRLPERDFPPKLYFLRVLVDDTMSLLRIDDDQSSNNFGKLGPIVRVT